jgi:hypothetical protein
MFKLILIVFAIFSLNHSWADCTVSDGENLVKIPETKTSSLFDQGKSLTSHKAQDQDGVGTCYSNSTSIALKTVLPDNPDVSYLHAAINASTNGWRQKNWDWTKRKKTPHFKKDDEKTFIDGGFVCETIAAMKKAGGACPAQFSKLENHEALSPEMQSRYMNSLSSYFDKINQMKKDPKQFEDYKNNLVDIISDIESYQTQLIQKCEEEKNHENLVVDRIQVILNHTIRTNIESDTPCSKERLKTITDTLDIALDLNNDRIKIQLPESDKVKFKALISSDPQFEELLNRYIENDQEDESIRDQAASELMKKLNTFFQSDKQISSELDCSEPLFDEEAVVAKLAIGAMHHKKREDCSEIDTDNFDHVLAGNKCEENFMRALATEQIKELIDLGVKIESSLIPDLTNTFVGHGNQISSIIMPECLKRSNLVPMNNISCSTFPLCDPSKYLNVDNYQYSGPAGKCYSIGSAKSIIGTHVFNAIKENRALTVSMCTAFMLDPSVKTNFCQNTPPGISGHSMHSMAISGYRCNQGKLEYEILNSWGANCPPPGYEKNSGIECVLDENGDPTGRFWLKEDLLVNNTTEINSVRKNKK